MLGRSVYVSFEEIYENRGENLYFGGTIRHITDDDGSGYYDLFVNDQCYYDNEKYTVLFADENKVRLENEVNNLVLYLTIDEYKVGAFSNASFDDIRQDCVLFDNRRHDMLINEWCTEAGVTSPVGYYNETWEHTITIYTDKPGRLIGQYGSLVEKFKEKLCDEFGTNDYHVKFVEVRGGFANI